MNKLRDCRSTPRRARVFVTAISALFAFCTFASAASAYEGDHYALTYYLALQLGFTKRQAFQIASGAYALDWDPHTGPMKATAGDVIVGAGHSVPGVPEFGNQPVSTIDSPSEKDNPAIRNATHPRIAAIWTDFHSFADESLLHGCDFSMQKESTSGKCGDALMELLPPTFPDQVPQPCTGEIKAAVEKSREDRKAALWHLSMVERNPGVLLHFVQDYYPHFRYDNFRGHAIEGHYPDFLSASPAKAECATVDSLQVLTSFRNYLATFTKNPNDPLLPQKSLTPDAQRIGQVVQQLIDANPHPGPGNLQNWNPEGPGRAAPILNNSLAVVARAVRQDEESGRLPKWPEPYDDNQIVPTTWMQYAYSPEGRIQTPDGGADERGPVEKVGLEFKQEVVDIEPDEKNPDNVKIHLKLPYSLTGVVPLQDRQGRYFLWPIPVIEQHQLSDTPSFLYKEVHKRQSGEHVAEIREELNRRRADIDAGKVVWTASVQVYGYEPKVKKITLRMPNLKCTPRSGPLLEALQVPNGWPGAQAVSKNSLEQGRCYTIEVVGHRLGTDAIYCFFDWRCGNQKFAPWQELTLDGFGLVDAAGSPIPYTATHDYSIGFQGKGKPLTARFSSRDETGDVYKQYRGSRNDGCTRSGADPDACYYQVKILGPQ